MLIFETLAFGRVETMPDLQNTEVDCAEEGPDTAYDERRKVC